MSASVLFVEKSSRCLDEETKAVLLEEVQKLLPPQVSTKHQHEGIMIVRLMIFVTGKI